MKTHALKSKLLLFLLASFLLASCKKFEEGPIFSLRSRKARITGTWTYQTIEVNGVDVKQSMTQVKDIRMIISKDHSFLDFGVSALGNTAVDNDTWKFTERRTHLTIRNKSKGVKFSYEILRLTNTELWLKMVGTDVMIKLAQ